MGAVMASGSGRGTALITGASAGIGAVYADRLAARGHDLVLVARDPERLAAVADRVGTRHGRSVRTVAADLTDAGGLAEVEALLRADEGITTLVNNAGFGAAGPLLGSDVERMAEMIAVNVTAVTRLSHALLPRLAGRGGTLINIASVAAIGPEILNGVYGGTKAFVLAFSQSLRKELAGTGARVQVVLPGATGTGFWEIAGNPLSNLPAAMVMSPDDLVDAALVGLDVGEFVTIPALPDVALWDAYEAARQAMLPNLSRSEPAARYARPAAA
jgi:uncharacterized protein